MGIKEFIANLNTEEEQSKGAVLLSVEEAKRITVENRRSKTAQGLETLVTWCNGQVSTSINPLIEFHIDYNSGYCTPDSVELFVDYLREAGYEVDDSKLTNSQIHHKSIIISW